MVIAITSYIMLYVGGANWKHLAGLVVVGGALVVVAIMMEDFRIERFIGFWDPFANPRDSGYQIIQSLYAIGSGGLVGVGLGQSMQKFGHIPEQHTDFIFSVLCEELGFFGASLVILLFIFFIARGFMIAKGTRDTFGSCLACGITTMIAVETIINIAVVTSSMPVTGITLPFISYGGSSLLFKMAAVGVLLNISRYRAKRTYSRGKLLQI
jgi:cell division protein FtsW